MNEKFIHLFITSIYIAPLQVGLLRGDIMVCVYIRLIKRRTVRDILQLIHSLIKVGFCSSKTYVHQSYLSVLPSEGPNDHKVHSALVDANRTYLFLCRK